MRNDVPQPSLARLRSKRKANFLGQRGRRADHRRGRVKNAADRVEIVLQPVIGERLDDHPCAVTGERRPDMGRRADGVAHIVQAVEKGDEIVAVARELLGRRNREDDAIADTGLFGGFAGAGDRRGMIVEAVEARFREGFRHHDGGCAVPAAHVGDLRAALELCRHAIKCGQPAAGEILLIAWAEEALRAAEQAAIMLMPAETRPLLNASASFGSLRNAAAAMAKKPARKTGLFSSAKTMACSGWVLKRMVSGS